MHESAGQLREEIDRALPLLRQLPESRVIESRGTGKWIRKEILGHLIDSAANNHQRFVRARFSDRYEGPSYDQEAWVAAHGYGQRSWTELVDLWAGLNRHLAAVMASVPRDRFATVCVVGGNPPAPLDWWMHDYVRHVKHHLTQILEE